MHRTVAGFHILNIADFEKPFRKLLRILTRLKVSCSFKYLFPVYIDDGSWRAKKCRSTVCCSFWIQNLATYSSLVPLLMDVTLTTRLKWSTCLVQSWRISHISFIETKMPQQTRILALRLTSSGSQRLSTDAWKGLMFIALTIVTLRHVFTIDFLVISSFQRISLKWVPRSVFNSNNTVYKVRDRSSSTFGGWSKICPTTPTTSLTFAYVRFFDFFSTPLSPILKFFLCRLRRRNIKTIKMPLSVWERR